MSQYGEPWDSIMHEHYHSRSGLMDCPKFLHPEAECECGADEPNLKILQLREEVLSLHQQMLGPQWECPVMCDRCGDWGGKANFQAGSGRWK